MFIVKKFNKFISKYNTDNAFRMKLFVFIACIILMLPTTHAGNAKFTDNVDHMLEEVMSGVSETVMKTVTPYQIVDTRVEPYDNPYYNFIFGPGFYTLLTTGSGNLGGGADGVVDKLQVVSKIIGIVLLFVYFLEGLFNKIEKGRDFKQSLLRSLLWLFVSLIIINSIVTILKYVIRFSLFCLSYIAKAITVEATSASGETLTKEQYYEQLYEGMGWQRGKKWHKNLGYMGALAIPYLATKAAGIFAKVQCFSTLVELGVKTAMAPWSFVDILSDGFHSAGFKNIQDYFALFIRIGIMIVICRLGGGLQKAAMNGAGQAEVIIATAAINLSVVTLMSKAAEWSKAIVGI